MGARTGLLTEKATYGSDSLKRSRALMLSPSTSWICRQYLRVGEVLSLQETLAH